MTRLNAFREFHQFKQYKKLKSKWLAQKPIEFNSNLQWSQLWLEFAADLTPKLAEMDVKQLSRLSSKRYKLWFILITYKTCSDSMFHKEAIDFPLKVKKIRQ